MKAIDWTKPLVTMGDLPVVILAGQTPDPVWPVVGYFVRADNSIGLCKWNREGRCANHAAYDLKNEVTYIERWVNVFVDYEDFVFTQSWPTAESAASSAQRQGRAKLVKCVHVKEPDPR